uniref:Translation initiation factor IF-2-like n=1 Tax=Parastrongyloides trichosuri TaxID=131310 RepID=A0A0N5A5U2_PARTI
MGARALGMPAPAARPEHSLPQRGLHRRRSGTTRRAVSRCRLRGVLRARRRAPAQRRMARRTAAPAQRVLPRAAGKARGPAATHQCAGAAAAPGAHPAQEVAQLPRTQPGPGRTGHHCLRQPQARSARPQQPLPAAHRIPAPGLALAVAGGPDLRPGAVRPPRCAGFSARQPGAQHRLRCGDQPVIAAPCQSGMA